MRMIFEEFMLNIQIFRLFLCDMIHEGIDFEFNIFGFNFGDGLDVIF